MFITASIYSHPNRKRGKYRCPPSRMERQTVEHLNNGILFCTVQNQLLNHAETWMSLKVIRPSERGQSRGWIPLRKVSLEVGTVQLGSRWKWIPPSGFRGEGSKEAFVRLVWFLVWKQGLTVSSLNCWCTSLSLWTPGITEVNHLTQSRNVYFHDVGRNGNYMNLYTYPNLLCRAQKRSFFAVVLLATL